MLCWESVLPVTQETLLRIRKGTPWRPVSSIKRTDPLRSLPVERTLRHELQIFQIFLPILFTADTTRLSEQ